MAQFEGWDAEALEAVWARAQETNHIKDAPSVKLELRRAKDLSPTDAEACFQIVKHTSYHHYKKSSTGWNPESKNKEMSHPSMMYLLIRAGSGNGDTSIFAPTLPTDIIAFASFMPDYDDPPHQTRAIIYIYEVHVGENFRGKGLGKFMVFSIEAMADTSKVSKTMLTVFKSNENAIKAYTKLGYVVDDSTPPDRKTRGRVIKADYMIMSKFWGSEETLAIRSVAKGASQPGSE
jgi:RimJ/RimL family protein N-acetyltransferase